MVKFAAAAIVLIAFSLPAAANPNCAKDYKAFWDQFSTGASKLTGEQHAIVSRQALRAYDSCSAGDEAGSKSIFVRLQEAAPAKGDDFWKSLSQTAPAKK